MNKSQRASLDRLVSLAGALDGYQADAEIVRALLDRRRSRMREIRPREDQTQIPV